MPELSRFYGLVVQIFVRDHAPPHFHVANADNEPVVDIRRGVITAAWLPARAQALALEWNALHRAELLQAWELASQGNAPGKIDPLP